MGARSLGSPCLEKEGWPPERQGARAGQGSMEGREWGWRTAGAMLLFSFALTTPPSPIYAPNKIIKAEEEPGGSHKGHELDLKHFSLESGGDGQTLSSSPHPTGQGWGGGTRQFSPGTREEGREKGNVSEECGEGRVF